MNPDLTHDALSVLFDFASAKGCRYCPGVKGAYLAYSDQEHALPLLFVLQALSLSLPPAVGKATMEALSQAIAPKREDLVVTGVMTRIRVDESLQALESYSSFGAIPGSPEVNAEIDFTLDDPSQLGSLRIIFNNHRTKISVA